MAVAHAFGFARDLNLHRPTETSTFVHHQSPRVLLRYRLSAAYCLTWKHKSNLAVCLLQLARVAVTPRAAFRHAISDLVSTAGQATLGG
jgi:hypothetical protein